MNNITKTYQETKKVGANKMAVLKKLSSDDEMELRMLEFIEKRSFSLYDELCSKTRVNTDISLGWVELCSIISPKNPQKVADKIFAHFNKDEKYKYEIYKAIENIGNDDVDFYASDAFYVASIATLITQFYSDDWKAIVNSMEDIHNKYPKLGLEVLFKKAAIVFEEK
jgi:hypothetical protein